MKYFIETASSLEVIKGTGAFFPLKKGVMLKNGRYSFQVAYRASENTWKCRLRAENDLGGCVTVREEALAPCTMPVAGTEYLISEEPTVYPDILREYGENGICLRKDMWQAAWVTVSGDNLPAGRHTLRFILSDNCGAQVAETSFELEILGAELEKSDLIYTNWFHYDGLSRIYGAEPFTAEYNAVLRNYVKNAAEHGMNMLYVPLFTPPLDTAVGGERMTAQLLDIEKRGDKYIFSFEKTAAFLALARECGIEYFEMPHLFTQWGAKFTPKIEILENGARKKAFGWHVAGDSPEYAAFLGQLLPELKRFLQSEGVYEKSYFHVSDEPNETMLESYSKARALLEKSLPDCKNIEALSHYDFYRLGYVKTPVVATNAYEAFREHAVKGIWVYTCCGQKEDCLSNRFMNFPPQRNRILGMQLYVNEIVGFLHWGYNFYNSCESLYPVDPYSVTDGGGTFESGDAFIVYPGREGPLDSARHEVFCEGLHDYRALKTLEKKIGRDKVLALLKAEGVEEGFKKYPKSAAWHVAFREKIDRMITE